MKPTIDGSSQVLLDNSKQYKGATLKLLLESENGYECEQTADISPLQWFAIQSILAQERMPEWVNLNWNDRTTWPEEMRKVWVISDRVKYEDEVICYRDGEFYRDNTDYPIDEALYEGMKWCYVVKPHKPE